MHCPFLVYHYERCEAVDPRHSPTDLDLDAYCLTDRYAECPLYRSHVLRSDQKQLVFMGEKAP